jgi:hypothetical protein
MKVIVTKRNILLVAAVFFLIAASSIFYAYARTWNKTEIEFGFVIDEQIVYRSTYGESPTFSIWLEDPESGRTQTIYVTNRAALGDWEGKADVPVALPRWFEIDKAEQEMKFKMDNKVPERIAITGATPQPGYFSTRVRVEPGSEWICWIEVNLAGDYNESFPEYDPVAMTYDEWGTGQPALLYRAEIVAEEGNMRVPEIAGMLTINPEKGVELKPLEGITTARDIFSDIYITVARPKPRIIGR